MEPSTPNALYQLNETFRELARNLFNMHGEAQHRAASNAKTALALADAIDRLSAAHERLACVEEERWRTEQAEVRAKARRS